TDCAFEAAGKPSAEFEVHAAQIERSGVGEESVSGCGIGLFADQVADGVVEPRNGHAQVMGEILLPYCLHGLDGFWLERGIGLVSGGGVVELEKIGGAEGLAVKKLEG